MTHDSSDNCGDPPSDFGTGLEFQRQRAAETAEERWERYQRIDGLRRGKELLERVSRPAMRQDVPLGFDPDDYPLR